MPRSWTPRTCAIWSMTSVPSFSSTSRLGPMILTELAPLTPEIASSTLSWMYCEKLNPTPGQFGGELLLQLVGQLVLGQSRRPLVERLQRHEQFDVGERRGIAAVVRPAVLRHHGDDLRMAQQDFADLPRRRGARIQVHGRRHRGADPEIAFLQRRQELAAQPRRQHAGPGQEHQPDPHHDPAVVERPAQRRRIDARAAPAPRWSPPP